MKAKSVCPAPVVVSDYFFKQLTDASLMEINAPTRNDKIEKPNEEQESELSIKWKCAAVTNNNDVNRALATYYTPLFYKEHMNALLSRENSKDSELEKEVNEMWERVKEVQQCNAERRAFFSRFTNCNKNENNGKENIVEELREQIQKQYTMWTSHLIAQRFNLQLSCNVTEQLQDALKEVKQCEHKKQQEQQEQENETESDDKNKKDNNNSDLHIAVHFRAIDKNNNKSKEEEQEQHTEQQNKPVAQSQRLRRLFTSLLQRPRDEFAANLSLLFGQLKTFQRNHLSELQSKLSECTMFDIPLHVVFVHIASYIQRTLCPLSQNDYDHTVQEYTRLLQAIAQIQNKRENFLLTSAHESEANSDKHDTLHKWSTVLDQYNTTHVNKKGSKNNNTNDKKIVAVNENKVESSNNNGSDEECKTIFSELPLSERYTLAEEMWQQLFAELDARKVFHSQGISTFHEMYNSGKVKHNTLLKELQTCDKITQLEMEHLQNEANECGRVIERIGKEITPVIDEANTTYATEFARLQNALEAKSSMLVKSEKEQERLARRVREAVKDLYKEQVQYASLSQEMLQDQLTQVQLTESHHSLLSALTTCQEDALQSHKLMCDVHELLSEAELRRQELIEMCEGHIARLAHDHYYTCGQLASLAERNCIEWEKCVHNILELYQRRFEKLSRSGTQSWQMEYLISQEREFAVENLLDVRAEYEKYTHAWRQDMTAIFDMLNNQENSKLHNHTSENKNKVDSSDNVVNCKQIITQDVRRALAQTKENKNEHKWEESVKDSKLQRIMEEIDGHWRVQHANTTLRKHNKSLEKQKHDNNINETEKSNIVESNDHSTASYERRDNKELKLNKSTVSAAGSGATAAVSLNKSGVM